MHTRTAVATLATLTALALTGCGPAEITSKPDTKTSAPAADASSAAPASSAPSKAATVGDTVTLKGNNDGEQLAVTLKKWVDPAESANEFSKPQDGKRYVSAQFELVNTGSVVYSDSPGNGAQVADSDGQQFHSTFAETKAGPEMTSSAKAAPGAKVLGWITFEVPKDSKVAKVQFSMNSGFASQTGEWTIP
ncbi:DUF4352 domain-containing protein [Streptomyces sp. NPDC002467]|uniref:DUF4352 domain-containing protein n=1 Tax=Streptomyces sp. NPDC002467 TaxID=3364647 RepID=UPI0036923BFF